jgi:acyl carrier protein
MKTIDQLICKAFKIEKEQLSDNLTSDDILDWDSLAQFHLVASIEETYQITIEMEDLFNMETIGDIRSIVEKKSVLT